MAQQTASWQPSLGSWPTPEGIRFRVWAPGAQTVEVVPESPASGGTAVLLHKEGDGNFTGCSAAFASGDRYRYRLDGHSLYPDPVSRFQPEGVHGPSQIIDPCRFRWSDQDWRGVRCEDLVIYELHVGTFTDGGSFVAVRDRLPALKELGVTAIELMPLADFPGRRNWGYDGVCPFAPARCYGNPEDLRDLVNTAHQLGLAVLLDVVYNHLGPDGNYLRAYSPWYFNECHRTPWGDALNYDGKHCEPVRRYFIENALHWLHEYHFDGLRLDAAHAILDDSPRHFLAELSDTIRASLPDREIVLIAEDDRNLARLLRPTSTGGGSRPAPAEAGFGLDAVWADDFHHQMRRCLAGDSESYYRDYTGTMEDLARTLRQGWFYTGQPSVNRKGKRRGTDPTGLALQSFVICLQNHDQIGNRAFGDRLHHKIDLAAFRAASALLLFAVETPLLFMGQEWAASTPFLFFTDHDPKLGRQVTEGRRREFRSFSQFADPVLREQIPDPQEEATFRVSVLDWGEAERDPHRGIRRLYQDLLYLRRTKWSGLSQEVTVGGTGTLLVRRPGKNGRDLLAVIALKPDQEAILPPGPWQVLLTTEDLVYARDGQPPRLDPDVEPTRFSFPGPAAVVLQHSL